MQNNATQAGRAPAGLVVMLSLALMVNYIDRGAIATAAPLLQKELALSPSEIGWVLAVFYWAYAPLQPVMGWLADRVGPALVLASGFALWSLATAATGLVWGLASLVMFPAAFCAGSSLIGTLVFRLRHLIPVAAQFDSNVGA